MFVIDRAHLRLVSRWVWALLALAVLWIVVAMISTSSFTVQNLYASFIAATPAIFAAALMYVAPHERRIQFAAFCFALPIAVNLVIGGGILLSAQSMGSDYAYLAPRLMGAGDAFSLISWAFPIIAMFALASYIGPSLTRRGWMIVGIVTVVAIIQAIRILASTFEVIVDGHVIASMLAQTIWIAWAYLLAVALDRRMRFFSLAAAAYLASAVLSQVAFSVFLDQLSDPSGAATQAVLAALWVLGVVSWAGLLVGILRELPRGETAPAARRGTHRALSTSG